MDTLKLARVEPPFPLPLPLRDILRNEAFAKLLEVTRHYDSEPHCPAHPLTQLSSCLRLLLWHPGFAAKP